MPLPIFTAPTHLAVTSETSADYRTIIWCHRQRMEANLAINHRGRLKNSLIFPVSLFAVQYTATDLQIHSLPFCISRYLQVCRVLTHILLTGQLNSMFSRHLMCYITDINVRDNALKLMELRSDKWINRHEIWKLLTCIECCTGRFFKTRNWALHHERHRRSLCNSNVVHSTARTATLKRTHCIWNLSLPHGCKITAFWRNVFSCKFERVVKR
jgi:hypothetical protein